MQQIIKRHYSTKKKNILLDIFKANSNKRLTADEIIQTLNKDKTVISKATVYRNLDLLVNQGVICKVVLDNICSCYIYKGDANAGSVNFYCDNCGEVIQVKSKTFINLNNKLKKELQFTVDESKTVIHGMCNKCKEHVHD